MDFTEVRDGHHEMTDGLDDNYVRISDTTKKWLIYNINATQEANAKKRQIRPARAWQDLQGQSTYSPISHNQWTQVGTGQTPVNASHLRAI